MDRRPEPELMDDWEQATAYAGADFEEVNQGLVDRFRRAFPDWTSGRMLDLGCGPADIPVRFCRALPDVEVDAVDGAPSMLALGREAVQAAGLSERVTLLLAHLPRVPLADRTYPALFSNSLLHHLSDPHDLWRSIARLGRPGASVMVCDLFRPVSEAEARRIVDEADCSDHPVLQHDFFNSLLAAYTLEEVRTQLEANGLQALQTELTSDRHLLVWGRLPA